MTTFEQIQNDLKSALRAEDAGRLSVLRMLSAAFQSKQIEKRAKAGVEAAALSDEEILAVLKQEAKKRQDAIQQFSTAKRDDLVEKEKVELGIIQAYLPKELSDSELEKIVVSILRSMGALTDKDFGKAMGVVTKETKGQASGDRVSAIVKRLLQK